MSAVIIPLIRNRDLAKAIYPSRFVLKLCDALDRIIDCIDETERLGDPIASNNLLIAVRLLAAEIDKRPGIR